MKKPILLAGFALLAFVMVLFTVSTQPSPSINQLYTFGDSLSDTGNVFRMSGQLYPPNPPYFQGRYSNGRVWVEYLASKLELNANQTANFAYGGATTAGSNNENGLPGMLAQVQQFTATHQQANPNALYILWAGANDYLQGAASATVPIDNISRAIAALVATGSKKILVVNLPDLGQLPATRNDSNASNLSALTRSHNLTLARSVDASSQRFSSDTQIFQLDINTLYQEAIATPSKFGFTNVTGACFDNQTICRNPDQFLFWDGIHPTTAAHKIMGDAAFSILQTRVFVGSPSGE